MNAPASPRHELPRWAEVLRQKYLAGEASTFVLYRNVFDNYLVGDRLHNLGTFLVEELFKDTKQQVCEISLERGIRVLGGKADGALAMPDVDADSGTLLASLLRSVSKLRPRFDPAR